MSENMVEKARATRVTRVMKLAGAEIIAQVAKSIDPEGRHSAGDFLAEAEGVFEAMITAALGEE